MTERIAEATYRRLEFISCQVQAHGILEGVLPTPSSIRQRKQTLTYVLRYYPDILNHTPLWTRLAGQGCAYCLGGSFEIQGIASSFITRRRTLQSHPFLV